MNRSRSAERIVSAAHKGLKVSMKGGAVVDSVTWYGAVDINPVHLVVWVLLSGRPDDELPEWYFPAPRSPVVSLSLVRGVVVTSAGDLDSAVVEACRTWRDEIQADFASAGWPNADEVSVGFDSSHRVIEGCGWHYFI